MPYTPKRFIKTSNNSLKSPKSTKNSQNNKKKSWMNRKEPKKSDKKSMISRNESRISYKLLRNEGKNLEKLKKTQQSSNLWK